MNENCEKKDTKIFRGMYEYIQERNTTITERTAEEEVERDEREWKDKRKQGEKWVLATPAYSK